jgi:hypothetical protein
MLTYKTALNKKLYMTTKKSSKRKALVKRGKGKYSKQYYAVLIADNGEPLAHTEHQTRKSRLKQMLAKYFPGFKIVEA